jgi:hypothetical protein
MVPEVVGAMFIFCALVDVLPIVTVPVEAPVAIFTVAGDETAGAIFTVELAPPTVIAPWVVAPTLISWGVGVAVFAPILSFPVAPVPVGELEAILTCVEAPPNV